MVYKRLLLMLLLVPSLWKPEALVAQQVTKDRYPAIGSPVNPKVSISWNRYYDTPALERLTKEIAEAHPGLVERVPVGKSFEGRTIWALVITDESTGPAEDKPAVYIDGNTHSNEIQAAEVSLYTAWLLTEGHHEDLGDIRELLKHSAFYILPSINPDGRYNFFNAANNMHSPRSGVVPHDDDRDGAIDEDNYDDLNGDGHITQMRRKKQGGRYRPHPQDPRILVPVKPGEPAGGYELLGYEGVDNDGDGKVNEDKTGYMDPNRDWAWGWQPNSIQRGAYKYPFSLPETRAVADFIRARPNIHAALTYHNTGGMLLVGPGNAQDKPTYANADKKIYDYFGNLGEDLLPGYKYINTFEDLYPVFGGESDWMYGARGIIAFTGELWTPYLMFNKDAEGYFSSGEEAARFDRLLLMREAFVQWETVEHPQYGEIEVGGFKKHFLRATPGFELEREAHRNAALALEMARQLPRLSFSEPRVKPLPGGVYQVELELQNQGYLPVVTAWAEKNKIYPPASLRISGEGNVLYSTILLEPELNIGMPESKRTRQNPDLIHLPNLKGYQQRTIRFMVSAPGNYRLEFTSERVAPQTVTVVVSE